MRQIFATILFFTSLTALAGNALVPQIEQTEPTAIEYLTRNISRPDTLPGFVVASPSKVEPNYYFHWTRDAALTMQGVQDILEHESNPKLRQKLEQMLYDYVEFSRRNQLTPTLSIGYGEPKFNPDGSGYTGSWGRPQTDGPALRALALIRFARTLQKDPAKNNYIRNQLYDSAFPTSSVVKADLEYVAHHWRDASFDLWEEVKGDHFYTHMVQRAALVEGSKLAADYGDHGAAAFYAAQANNLELYILNYWDHKQRFFRATMNNVGGVDYKYSNVDAAVVLGLLHGHTNDGFLKFNDPRVVSTVSYIENAFRHIYSINQNGRPGVAIGRYPEDRYDGITTHTIGNPWFITTFAMAEYYYRAGRKDKGDEFMDRGLSHRNQDDSSMSEQINRYTGHMQGATHLTWSYASFLTAAYARR
jgi:glucoamylase